MKTKKQIYLFAAVFLFLSVFLVRLDGINSVAKADCASECGSESDCSNACVNDDDPGTCTANCMSDLGTCVAACPTSSAPASSSDSECPYGYKPDPSNSENCIAADGCAEGQTLVNGVCTDESGNTSDCPYGTLDDGKGNCVASDGCAEGQALVNGVCKDANGNESDCDYGYLSDGKGNCVPADNCPDGSALVNGKCTDANGDALTGGTKGTPCGTDSECASGLVCNTVGGTCGQSIFGAVTNTITGFASSVKLNGVQVGMKNGNLTVGANISIGGTSVPAGSYVSNGAVYSPGGTVLGISTTTFMNALGVGPNGQPLNSPNSFPGSGGGAPGTTACSGEVVGGVCFPGGTGLSDASISQILLSLLDWILEIFTTLAILAFVISGVQYLISAGDEGMIEKAKTNAKWSIVGIIVGLSGFVILQAVAALISGTSQLF